MENAQRIKLIRDGLAEQVRILRLYLIEDYATELCGEILTTEQYHALRDAVCTCHESLKQQNKRDNSNGNDN